jgi:hypothetical protein
MVVECKICVWDFKLKKGHQRHCKITLVALGCAMHPIVPLGVRIRVGIQRGNLGLRRKGKYWAWIVGMEYMKPVNYVRCVQVTNLWRDRQNKEKKTIECLLLPCYMSTNTKGI